MNKILLTNLVSFLIIVAGVYINNQLLILVGLFALSGAITNWLAIHLLFEKVPGLIGSGVVPNQFNAFKQTIKQMMMDQFFTKEHIIHLMANKQKTLNLVPVIEKIDLTPAFDNLIKTIMESNLVDLLGSLEEKNYLYKLKDPFIKNIKNTLVEITQSQEFTNLLEIQLNNSSKSNEIQQKIFHIIDSRLAELTPEIVKQIVQKMIKEHLGWLVVWGGILGGIIGLISGYFMW